MRKFIYSIILIFIGIFFVACGKENYTLAFEDTQKIVTIGDEFSLELNTNIPNLDEITYDFSKEGYITFTNNKFSANLVGEVDITATWEKDKKVTASIKVVVEDLEKSVTTTTPIIEIAPDATASLNLNFVNLTPADLDFSFSKAAVAELVDGTKVKGLEEGTTVLSIKDKNSQETYLTITINVVIERKISSSESVINMMEGMPLKLELELLNLTYDDLGYSLSEQGVIKVSSTWNLLPLKVGEVVLTIFALEDDSVSLELTIIIDLFRSIEFDFSSIQLEVDDSEELNLNLLNIELQYVELSVDNEDVVELQGFNITAKQPGTATITATYINNPEINATLEITVVEEIFTIYDYQYWVENLDPKYDAFEVIMNQTEIDAYNAVIFSDYQKTKVVDLFNYPLTATKAEIEALIKSYNNMNSYTVYDDNDMPIQNATKMAIEISRNLSAIPETKTLEYGIVTDFAALRSYPTYYYSQGKQLDRFQETALNVGEGVVVYHASNNGKWYFVQAQNYYGWIEATKVALTSLEQMKNFLDPEQFVMILADRITIEGVPVRMGQRVPLANETNDAYEVLFPKRNEEGNLVLENITLSKELDLHVGYLDYTLENVFRQGFKMLGIPYSWGDKYIEGRDCSSTQAAIYATFGFKMPRNTSNQNQVPGYSKVTTGPNALTIPKLINEYRPGTLIFTPGHVLMYIGEDADGVSYVFHTTTSTLVGPAGSKVQTLSSIGISSVNATLILYN